jgi:hypothetical protein
MVWLTLASAVIVFAVVQDRVTADGARQYVALQRRAVAGEGRLVTIDEALRPAVDRSVRLGLLSSGAVLVVGLGAAVVISRRDAR